MLKVAHCQYCKAEIDWDVQKCRHCGEWIGEPQAAAPAIGQPVDHYVPRRDFELSGSPGILGWLGTAALAGGVFLPFISMPIIGGLSMWDAGKDGVFVFAAGLVAMFAHWRQWRWLMLAGAVPATGVVGYDTYRLISVLGQEGGGMFGVGIGGILMLAGGIAAVIAAWRMER